MNSIKLFCFYFFFLSFFFVFWIKSFYNDLKILNSDIGQVIILKLTVDSLNFFFLFIPRCCSPSNPTPKKSISITAALLQLLCGIPQGLVLGHLFLYSLHL